MPPASSRAERIGRRAILGIFVLLVGGFTLHNTVRSSRQVVFSPSPAATADCRRGVVRLVEAVREARRAAALEDRGERASLAQFRGTLEQSWEAREGLDTACRGDPRALRALRDVDRLRYAEEHAVRSDAVDLARLRRRVHVIKKEFTQPARP